MIDGSNEKLIKISATNSEKDHVSYPENSENKNMKEFIGVASREISSTENKNIKTSVTEQKQKRYSRDEIAPLANDLLAVAETDLSCRAASPANS